MGIFLKVCIYTPDGIIYPGVLHPKSITELKSHFYNYCSLKQSGKKRKKKEQVKCKRRT